MSASSMSDCLRHDVTDLLPSFESSSGDHSNLAQPVAVTVVSDIRQGFSEMANLSDEPSRRTRIDLTAGCTVPAFILRGLVYGFDLSQSLLVHQYPPSRTGSACCCSGFDSSSFGP